jgi:outer membrane protein assembly factor BamB
VKQLVLWHPEGVNALDPSTGKVFWTVPWKLRHGLSIATPQQSGDHLFFTAFYNGGLLLKLNPDRSKPDVVWQTKRASERRTTHLNSIMGSPYITGGHIYGVCSYGEFRCLEVASGKRVWETMATTTGEGNKARWANVFVTPHRDRYFLFNERGELIIANLSPTGYTEIDRAKIIEPNGRDMNQRKIVWSHPAYADKRIFVRNDTEVRCYSLAK